MEVANYNSFLPTNSGINLNDLCCKWPFRMTVVGPSGSGKTNMVVDMVLNHVYWDDLYVMAKDLEEPFYIFLAEKMRSINEQLAAAGMPTKGARFSSHLDLDVDALDRDRQSLIIIDDFITAKDQKIAEELFIRGRKKNASVIYISQSYFKVPMMIRLNSSYFALFKIANKKQLRTIADVHSTMVDYDDFMGFFKEIHSEPYKFMLIDNVTTNRALHIRCCWDGVVIPAEASGDASDD